MGLAVIQVSRLKQAAAKLADLEKDLEPNARRRDPTAKALALSAAQNAGGTVSAPQILADLVDQLLAENEPPAEPTNTAAPAETAAPRLYEEPTAVEAAPEVDPDAA